MKKVIVGLSIALLALGAMGCSKDKGAKSAANDAEVLRQIEVKSAINDPRAADPSAALTCTYALIRQNGSSYDISKAEVKTSGSCNFADLKGKAAAAGSLDSAKAAQVVAAISGADLISSAQDAMNCRAYNVVTSGVTGGLQDCSTGNGSNDAAAKAITAILGL